MTIEGSAALSAADEKGGGADRLGLPFGDQYEAGQTGAFRAFSGRGQQGRGQPRLA